MLAYLHTVSTYKMDHTITNCTLGIYKNDRMEKHILIEKKPCLNQGVFLDSLVKTGFFFLARQLALVVNEAQ